jgi:hypothetical protein
MRAEEQIPEDPERTRRIEREKQQQRQANEDKKRTEEIEREKKKSQ